MRAAVRLIALVLIAGVAMGTPLLSSSVSYFTLNSVYEQTLVSHQRLRFTINTGMDYFPYTGQVGWRLLFSRYEMGDSDPQFEYAVWAMPSQGSDLSQEIWIVRPEGLVGEWHCRIDAVDATRKVLATSLEFIHDFSQEEAKTCTGMLPYVASDSYWLISMGVTNPNDSDVVLKMYVYDTTGDPYPVNHGANEFDVVVPAHGTWAAYLKTVVGLASFYGHIEMTADKPLSWIAILGTADNPAGPIQTGEVK